MSKCIVGIPPISIADRTVSYGQFLFKNDEFGQLSSVKLAVATTCLLGAKSIFYWLYHKYLKEWISQKTETIKANYIVNILLDLMARQRIYQIEGKDFYNDIINVADALSATLLLRNPKDFSELIQKTIICHLLNVPSYAPASITKIAESFQSKLNSGRFNVAKIIDIVNDHMTFLSVDRASSKIKIETIDRSKLDWDRFSVLADELYTIINKIPGKWHTAYLPYSNGLCEGPTSSLFGSKVICEEEFVKAGQYLFKGNHGGDDDPMWLEIFFELAREEKRNGKIFEKLLEATRDQHFSSIGIPICDYVSYHDLYSELGSQIRRIIERVRLVKNVLDENTLEESGSIDLQVAIQAVASETPRNDIFTKDENLQRSESWTILIDSSLSLAGSTKQVKAVSICLAEAAREIMGSGPWAMFAFSDNLYCIKDFKEPYDNNVRARIGGLSPSGLSFIPDAIRACRTLISEHAKDKNYLILISDGNATGYAEAEREFTSSIKALTKSGIDLAVIGVAGSGIKKIIRHARVIEEPTDIVKEFMELYYGLSSQS